MLGMKNMYKKILVATGGSEHSLRAADHAFNIAKCTEGSHVEVVYVVDNSKAKSDVLYNWNKLSIDDVRKDMLKTTEDKAKEFGISYKVRILRGDPGPTLVKYINENEFELAVLGSRGLNTLQELVLGSVSHKVTKRAKCPVLIVKH